MAQSIIKANFSLVLYNQQIDQVKTLIQTAAKVDEINTIYLIDNSPTDKLKDLATIDKVTYIFNNKNIGFGAGHNIAIKKSLAEKKNYHFIVNPDIDCSQTIYKQLLNYMHNNNNVGLIAPKVQFPDGTLQYSVKLLPNPIIYFKRRFLKHMLQEANAVYELKK